MKDISLQNRSLRDGFDQSQAALKKVEHDLQALQSSMKASIRTTSQQLETRVGDIDTETAKIQMRIVDTERRLSKVETDNAPLWQSHREYSKEQTSSIVNTVTRNMIASIHNAIDHKLRTLNLGGPVQKSIAGAVDMEILTKVNTDESEEKISKKSIDAVNHLSRCVGSRLDKLEQSFHEHVSKFLVHKKQHNKIHHLDEEGNALTR